MWMFLGDFNDINSHKEKEGVRRKSQRSIDVFNAIIEDISMKDLGVKTQLFTWSNNRRGEEQVHERFVCVLINARWSTNFQTEVCINELSLDSDHSPLVLLMKGEPRRRRRNF